MKFCLLAIALIFAAPVWGFDATDMEFMRKNGMLENELHAPVANSLEPLRPLAPLQPLDSETSELKVSKVESFKSYKGQKNSLVEWSELDANEWMDFNQWKLQRAKRDKTPQWRLKARDLLHREVIGKVVQCLNNCEIYTGQGGSKAQYGSVLKEGDEFSTGKDSYAWIFMVDGTLARVSPKTSISFFEVNIAKKKIFFSARLNQGHVYFQRRGLGVFPKQDMAETDLAFYPLLLKEANREYYARMEYQALEGSQRLNYNLANNQGYVSQYEKLNKLIKEFPESAGKFETEIFIYSANASFLVKNPNFHIFHKTAGQTWFKARRRIPGLKSEDSRAQTAKAFFRGYTNREVQEVPLDVWHAMNVEGTDFSPTPRPPGFDMIRQFVKRTPSIHLAREIFLRQESRFLLEDWDKKKLALEYGYRLWDEEGELEKRKSFLTEHTRRMETTNLRSVQKIFGDAALGGQEAGLGKEYYSEALSRTLMALKNLHDYNSEVVKETDDAQYYLWIMKHAKPFLPTYLR